MDYTKNPEKNMQPAYSNFKFLAQLYGTVDGSPVPTDNTTSASAEALSTTETTGTDHPVADSGSGNGIVKDILGFFGKRRALDTKESSLPPAVAAALDDIDLLIDNGWIGSEADGWRMLYESPHGHAHEIDLGDGFTVQIHVLRR